MADLPHRLLLLVQMLLIVLIAMEARVSVTGDSRFLVLEYGLLLLTVALLYLRAWRAGGSEAGFAGRMAALNATSAVFFFVGIPLPETSRLVLASLGLTFLVLSSLVMLSRVPDFSEPDEEHFSERMGAFTLIVCGESFVEVAISVSRATIRSVDVLSLIFEFVLVFALFSSYFEDIPDAGLNQRRFGAWASLHLVAQICIAGTAIAASKLVTTETATHLSDIEILRLTVPLALLYVALAGIGASTRRRPIGPLVRARIVTAIIVVIVGVTAWWLPWIHMVEALPILVALAVLHAAATFRLVEATTECSPDSLRPG